MSIPKIVVHTDVFLDHLLGGNSPSSLRMAMGKFFCYATVFQAIELFSIARTAPEIRAVEDAMAAMKLLGVNPKNAKRYGDLFSEHKRRDRWNLLVAGLCLESRLPLLTDRKTDFKGIKGLTIVSTSLVATAKTGVEILAGLRRS